MMLHIWIELLIFYIMKNFQFIYKENKPNSTASENCYERISRKSEWQQEIAQQHYRFGETALIKMNRENYTPSQKEKQEALTDVT